MYKILQQIHRQELQSYIESVSTQITWQSAVYALYIKKPRLELVKQSFFYRGAILFQSISRKHPCWLFQETFEYMVWWYHMNTLSFPLYCPRGIIFSWNFRVDLTKSRYYYFIEICFIFCFILSTWWIDYYFFQNYCITSAAREITSSLHLYIVREYLLVKTRQLSTNSIHSQFLG